MIFSVQDCLLGSFGLKEGMESSDDESKAQPLSVSNYHFEDGNDEHVSFSVLPIQWSESERIGDEKVKIFLYGNADNVLQKIYKHVIAWKFDLSNAKPEISVLSKENCWIKLLKPRKSFEGIVRSILITVHCLHFVMRHPETSGKSLWSHMLKLFRYIWTSIHIWSRLFLACFLSVGVNSHFYSIYSLHEVKAFESELVDHFCLITEAFTRNEALAKSKVSINFTIGFCVNAWAFLNCFFFVDVEIWSYFSSIILGCYLSNHAIKLHFNLWFEQFLFHFLNKNPKKRKLRDEVIFLYYFQLSCAHFPFISLIMHLKLHFNLWFEQYLVQFFNKNPKKWKLRDEVIFWYYF